MAAAATVATGQTATTENTTAATAAAAATTTTTTWFTYTVPSSAVVPSGSDGQIRIAQVWGVNEVGTKLWDTQLLLAKRFETHDPPLASMIRPLSTGAGAGAADSKTSVRPMSRWIELGAGCGLLALILYRLGCDVTATEIPEIMPLLESNIKANLTPNELSAAAATATSASAAGGGPRIRSAKLFWGLPADLIPFTVDSDNNPLPAFDGVVASDVTYIDELIVPLLETIDALSDSRTYIAVAGRIRSESAHLMFVTHAQSLGFDVDVQPLNSPTPNASTNAATATAPSAAAGTDSKTSGASAAGATNLNTSAAVESDTDHFDSSTTYDFICRLRKRSKPLPAAATKKLINL